ncbi:MAG: PAS domain S-box protein [Cyanobacteria bacterium SBLK]|nr:PAS domain S-box protein [Cyanobacteria bacterium SBLK]
MSQTLKDDRQRIAELEENNQHLQQQLAEAQQHYQEQSRELQKMRAEFSRSERFLREGLDNISEAVLWKDRNSVYLGCNRYYARAVGLGSPDEIVGKTDRDLPWTIEKAELYREGDRRVMDSNTPELDIIESRQQADGSHRQLKIDKIPVSDDQGNVIGILDTFIDISDRVEAEKTLKQQAIAIDAAADGIAILKEENFIYANQSFADLLGYNAPETLIGQNWRLLYNAREIECFEKEIVPLVNNKGSWQGEVVAKRKDGSTFIQELSLNITEERGFVCICRNITQRKQAEFALQQLNEELERGVEERTRTLQATESRWQRLTANLPGVIFQFRLAADGTPSFPYVSEGSRKIYELEPDNFLQVFDLVHPSDRDDLDRAIEESTKTLERFHHEYRIITPSGIVRWLQAISKPERQKDGATVWDGLVIDISDRKAFEAALSESEERFRLICEQTGQLVYDWDIASGKITRGGAIAAVTGYTIEEFAPFDIKNWEALIHPDDRPRVIAYLERSMAEGRRYRIEYRWRQKARNYIDVEDIGVFLTDEKGDISRMLGTTYGICDRKAAEKELQEQKQLLHSFYDGIAHPIFVVDALENGDFRHISFNRTAEQFFGKTNEELIHQTVEEIFLPEQARLVRQNYRRCVAEATSVTYEVSLQLQNQTFWFLTTINPIKDATGRVYRLVGTAIDISDRKATEESLRQQEEQYRQIFETVTDGLGIIDLETGEIVEINQAYHQIHGYTYDEFMSMPLSNYVHPDSLPILARFVEEIQAARSFLCRAQNIHRDGTTIDLDIKGIPFPYRGKTHALAIVRDISEKVRLERDREDRERTLQEKEALLQTTLKAGKLGCWCWNRHRNTMIWSDGVESVLGLYATSFGNTLDDYLDLIHPEDRETVESAIARTLATGREYHTEHRLVLPDGRIQWMRGTGEIWQDDRGEAIGLLGSILNDTQRKAAELALIESADQIRQQARQDQLLNQIANQIRTSLNLDRILETTVREIRDFLQVDRCHVAWYRRETDRTYWDVTTEVQNPDLPSFIGKHPAESFRLLSTLLLREQIVKLDDTTAIDDPALRETLAGLGNKSMLVLPVCFESGKFGVIACIHHQSVRPWRDSEIEFLEAVVAQVAIAVNQAELLTQSQTRARELEELLTKFQRTQTQLIQSEKMSSLGQMVAGVAHEINNPVSFIHGNLVHANAYIGDLLGLIDLYQDFYPQPHPDICEEIEAIDLDFLKGDLQKLFQSMRVGTDRIREIVKSLRTFSRLDEAEVKDVDLHEGIDSTLMILQTRLRAQDWRPQIEVRKEYGQLPRVQCYAGQLNQVFMNILGNAIDALEERDRDRTPAQMKENPSQIRIQTECKDENIFICIGDNGNGMSKETRAKLFDPFFTTKAVGKGTGLGLSISYQIVTEKHDGKLSCTSEPGETTFTIEIPAIGEKGES